MAILSCVQSSFERSWCVVCAFLREAIWRWQKRVYLLEELRLLCLVAALWGLVAVGFPTAVSCSSFFVVVMSARAILPNGGGTCGGGPPIPHNLPHYIPFLSPTLIPSPTLSPIYLRWQSPISIAHHTPTRTMSTSRSLHSLVTRH